MKTPSQKYYPIALAGILAVFDSSGCSRKVSVPPSPFPPHVVEAWVDAGAWIATVRPSMMGYRSIHAVPPASEPGDLPAFQYWPDNLPDLPDPGMKFGLVLSQTEVTDGRLHQLGHLKSLEVLDLSYTKVTGATLKDLAVLESLQSLTLRKTLVTDAGLKDIKTLKGLQTLDLGDTKITDSGLKHLADSTGLQRLNLWSTGITDTGLKDLAVLTKLKALDLRLTAVTDTGLKALVTLTSLTTLFVGSPYGGNITDASLKDLAGLRALKHLYLNGTEVTEDGLRAFHAELPDCKVHR